jgi:hypothetical protein
MEAIVKLKKDAPVKVRAAGMYLGSYHITVKPKKIVFKDSKEFEQLLKSKQFAAYMEVGEGDDCCDPCLDGGPCEGEVAKEEIINDVEFLEEEVAEEVSDLF